MGGVRLAALAPLLVALPALAGCVSEVAPSDVVVGYPSLGEVALYRATGAYVELARWENGHAFVAGSADIRLTLGRSDPVLDGARHVHPAFEVVTELAETGIFQKHSDRYVSPEHQAVIEAWYPISGDIAVLSFDERGFPWLFGASALFGAELSRLPRHEFELPDNLGRGQTIALAWVVDGQEEVGGVATTRLRLEGSPSLAGTLWTDGSAWPVKARLSILDAGLAPHVRVDGAYPATMEATRVRVEPGDAPLPPRNRDASFGVDDAATRVPWDGETPPDGAAGYIAYPLADAVRDAKLLDKPLMDWLAAASDPRIYRGTYMDMAGPAEGTVAPTWLLQWMDEGDRYYEVEIARITALALGQGIPKVNRSGPADAPRDPVHGWFAASDVPERFVPLSEGVRIVKEVFGAPQVQIFLRSLRDPPGYSYYIDGGFDAGGRYTVVYDPNTAFLQEATGPVTPRFVKT